MPGRMCVYGMGASVSMHTQGAGFAAHRQGSSSLVGYLGSV